MKDFKINTFIITTLFCGVLGGLSIALMCINRQGLFIDSINFSIFILATILTFKRLKCLFKKEFNNE
jgi:hypothetical protein